MIQPPKYVVAQLGARMHYGVPRLLARAGMLERLYTDFYSGPMVRKILSAFPMPSIVTRSLTRYAEGIPTGSVVSFPTFGLWYAARQRRTRNEADRAAAFLWAGSRFCNLVCAKGFGAAGAVYAYNDAALEILIHARKRGLFTVLEQTIAPLAIESELLDAERAKFPEWDEDAATANVAGYTPTLRLREERCLRQQEEWNAADVIFCGSEFVVDGIRRLRGPSSRCVVVPYGVEGIAEPRRRSVPRTPLRVLTVGAVGLRKGSPYLLQAARAMGNAAQFRMVGPVHLSPAARAEVQSHVHLTGPVPRGEVRRHYEWADVFLLPSICEGSATATYEALAAGLPVLCTPNTGSVVTDGLDGFIVPACDHGAISDRLERFFEPGVLDAMSAAALAKARQFDMEAYGLRALAALVPEALVAR